MLKFQASVGAQSQSIDREQEERREIKKWLKKWRGEDDKIDF